MYENDFDISWTKEIALVQEIGNMYENDFDIKDATYVSKT